METQAHAIHLIRIDDAANMARFYSLSITPALFGMVALGRSWGRIGTWGQTRIALHSSHQDALRELQHLLEGKLRRGYRHHSEEIASPIARTCI